MITTLTSAMYILTVLEIIVVGAIVLIAVDLAYYNYVDYKNEKRRGKHSESELKSFLTDAKYVAIHIRYVVLEIRFVKINPEAAIEEERKAQIRRDKEASANGGFFEESFVNGFGTTGELLYRGEHRFPSEEMAVLSKKMDERADNQIFENTEEL